MDKRTTHISIVTPEYGCANMLQSLYDRLVLTLSQITQDFEIIMVNDASGDNAWDIITQLAQQDKRVKGINFSRNFGQHRAITAGLDYARGDWIVVMDCDLQDQPEEILKFYKKALEGYDAVIGKRTDRKDGFFKRFGSLIFYKIYNFMTDATVDKSIGNFGIYSKRIISSVGMLREQNRSFGLFALWAGYKRVEIEITHAPRESGKSSYTLFKLIDLAIDSIIAHSNKPLKLSIKIGFSLSFLSFLYSAWLVVSYIFWSTPIAGWTSLIVSIYFLAGLIIGSIGMLGLYIGKIFDEVKQRPLYIIQETTFKEEIR
jgi:dolichol-phosphate mannosyltransferase